MGTALSRGEESRAEQSRADFSLQSSEQRRQQCSIELKLLHLHSSSSSSSSVLARHSRSVAPPPPQGRHRQTRTHSQTQSTRERREDDQGRKEENDEETSSDFRRREERRQRGRMNADRRRRPTNRIKREGLSRERKELERQGRRQQEQEEEQEEQGRELRATTTEEAGGSRDSQDPRVAPLAAPRPSDRSSASGCNQTCGQGGGNTREPPPWRPKSYPPPESIWNKNRHPDTRGRGCGPPLCQNFQTPPLVRELAANIKQLYCRQSRPDRPAGSAQTAFLVVK